MNESPFKGKTGLVRVWNAFHYSMAGLAAAYRNEDAFRQEVLLAALLIPLALWLPASGVGKALMIFSVLLVILVELINSAVEAAVDRISLEQHHLAKRAKQMECVRSGDHVLWLWFECHCAAIGRCLCHACQ